VATSFPGSVDDFATTSPTNLGDDDSTGRTHTERHNDMESAMEAVQTRALYAATNAQTDSYTLVLTDLGKMVEMGKGTAQDLTVPLNSSVAFPVGSRIQILQTGAGQVTVVATGGVTINAKTGLKLSGQWAGAELVKRATDTWVLIGALSA
jgi:hypothetical protein